MSKVVIDITKEHCPMTFVKVKLALAKLDFGDELEVILSAGEPLENVPLAAKEAGHTVVHVEPQGKFFSVLIIK